MSDDLVAVETSLVDMDEELKSEFRVVIVDGKRRGVRLERLYWRLLGEIAAERGMRRSRLTAKVLQSGSETDASAAGTLRGYVAKALQAERQKASALYSETALIELMQHAPVPAFAISRQKKLSKVNREFLQLMRMTLGNMRENPSPDVVQMSFDTPIEALFAQAGSSNAAFCNYSLDIGDRHRRGQVKLVAVPPLPGQTLIGYIRT